MDCGCFGTNSLAYIARPVWRSMRRREGNATAAARTAVAETQAESAVRASDPRFILKQYEVAAALKFADRKSGV